MRTMANVLADIRAYGPGAPTDIHSLARELADLIDLDLIGQAIGDARAYRIDDGSTDPDDITAADEYRRYADRVGLDVMW
jgi:hypothetical protein